MDGTLELERQVSLSRFDSEEEQHSSKGCSVLQGPAHRIALAWFVMDGQRCVQLYLWLGKDWSWCELRWFYSALVLGALAILWILGCIVLAARDRVFSEVFLK